MNFADQYGPWAVVAGASHVAVYGPTFPPGPSPVGGFDRRTAVELISQAGAALRT